MTPLQILPVAGLPEVGAGDDLGGLIVERFDVTDGDVVVVTQKVVSKAEGRVVALERDEAMAHRNLVEQESVRVLRRRGDLVVSETSHGFVCATAGIDRSNLPARHAALLPLDSDRSARRIRDRIRALAGVEAGVVVSDTFGRPWRRGVTDVAIGCAGVAGVVDLRGSLDASGRALRVTQVAVADELAAAAELVMGKSSGVPAAVIRGVDAACLREGSVRHEIVRRAQDDLFR